MAFDLDSLVRPNIRDLVPYSSARGEFTGGAEIFLDANENSFGSLIDVDYSRYPDPLQTRLKRRIADLNEVDPTNIFVGHGSDEAIDLLMRIFCEPGRDSILICPPTYGMYEVSAAINDVSVIRVPLADGFELDTNAVLQAVTDRTKLIFLCSPNNPTGNSIGREEMLRLAASFAGIVVIDEAYIHFAKQPSLLSELSDLPNLVVMQTLSKAWGLAALRVGFAFAATQITRYLNAVKPPYNVSRPAQEIALRALNEADPARRVVAEIASEREKMARRLAELPVVRKVFRSDANFLLVRFDEPNEIYRILLEKGIVVRNRSSVAKCEGCLRITVGTAAENDAVLTALRNL